MVELHHSAKQLHVEPKGVLLLHNLPISCIASPFYSIPHSLCYFSLAATSKCKDNTAKALFCTVAIK